MKRLISTWLVVLAAALASLGFALPSAAQSSDISDEYSVTQSAVNNAADGTQTQPAATIERAHILIATNDISWDDVLPTSNATPQLTQFVQQATIGNAIATTGTPQRCLIDGWLAINTGTRTTTSADGTCITPTYQAQSASATVSSWPLIAERVSSNAYAPHLGAFTAALETHSIATIAVGPGAVIALADHSGTTQSPTYAPATPEELTDVIAQNLAPWQLVIVDTSIFTGSAIDVLDQTLAATFQGIESSTLAATDVGVTVVSLTDARTPAAPSPSNDPGALGIFALASATSGASASTHAGIAQSNTTRQPGLVMTTDIPATILADFGVTDTQVGIGSVISSAARPQSTPEERFTVLTNLSERIYAAEQIRIPVIVFVGICGIILLALVIVAQSRSRGASARTASGWKAATYWVSLALACVPAAGLTASGTGWWHSSWPTVTFLAAGIGFGVALALFSHMLGRRMSWPISPAHRVVVVIAAATWTVIACDIVRGAVWSTGSPFGTQPLQAGRFYGMNNTAFAFFAVGTLFLIALAGRAVLKQFGRPGWILVVGFALLSVVIDVAPAIGADLGGSLALIPGIAIALWAVSGARISWRRIIVAVMVGALVTFGVGIADALRPAMSRTHLGDFVSTLWSAETLTTLRRKFDGAFGIFIDEPWLALIALVVIVALIYCGRLLLDGTTFPDWAWSVVVTCVVGTLLNDSGLAVAAWMVLLAGSFAVILQNWTGGRAVVARTVLKLRGDS